MMDLVGLAAVPRPALSARVLGRPAAAHRHRPRAGPGARAHRLRRAGLGARRVDPGAGAQPAASSLQRELGLTYLFIAHNMGVVEHISDRVAVMYLGRVAELADRESMYRDPQHPYTQALMSAIPVPDPTLRRKRIILTGDVPSPREPALGLQLPSALLAAGAPRRPGRLRRRDPGAAGIAAATSVVACHFAERSRAELERSTAELPGVSPDPWTLLGSGFSGTPAVRRPRAVARASSASADTTCAWTRPASPPPRR